MSQMSRRLILTGAAAAGVVNTAQAQENRNPGPPPPPPSFAGQTILVAGATGRTGKFIVASLLANGAKVRAFSRNIDQAKKDVPKAEWIKADVKDAASLKGIAKGCDRVVFAIGSNSFRDPSNKPDLVDSAGVIALANEAKAAKAKQYVLISSIGVTDPAVQTATGFAAVLRYKLEGEKGLAASGVPHTIIRPAGLWDRPGGEFNVALLTNDANIGAMVSREDVASVVVYALATDKVLGKTFTCFNVPGYDVHAWKRDFPKIVSV